MRATINARPEPAADRARSELSAQDAEFDWVPIDFVEPVSIFSSRKPLSHTHTSGRCSQ